MFPQRQHGITHHDFRAADHGDGVFSIEGDFWNEAGHHPDVAGPGGSGVIDADAGDDGVVAGPGVEIRGEDEVVGAASPREDHDPAVAFPVGEGMQNDGSQGRDPDASGHEDEVAPGKAFNRPRGSEGPAHPEGVAGLEGGEGRGDGSDPPDGVDEGLGLGGVSADGDGGFPGPKSIEHVELARGEPIAPGPRGRLEAEGEGVVVLALVGENPEGGREHGIASRRGGLESLGTTRAHVDDRLLPYISRS